MKFSVNNLVKQLTKLIEEFEATIPNLGKPETQYEIRWDLSQQWNARKGEIRSFWGAYWGMDALYKRLETLDFTVDDSAAQQKLAELIRKNTGSGGGSGPTTAELEAMVNKAVGLYGGGTVVDATGRTDPAAPASGAPAAITPIERPTEAQINEAMEATAAWKMHNMLLRMISRERDKQKELVLELQAKSRPD